MKSGISVLMTAKNAQDTISRSIAATLRALDDNSELLVLADGCVETELEARKFSDKRVKVFAVDRSLGRSLGRNYLAHESTKKYLAVTDADDLDLPWRFKMLLKAIENHDAVFANHILFGKPIKTKILPALPLGLSKEQIQKILVFKNPLNHCTSLYSRDLFFDLGMYPSFDVGEDYDLWLRMATTDAKMIRLPGYVTLYRQHEHQSIRAQSFENDVLNNSAIQEKRVLLAKKLGFELDLNDNGEIINRREASETLIARDSRVNFEVNGIPSKLKRFLKGTGN